MPWRPQLVFHCSLFLITQCVTSMQAQCVKRKSHDLFLVLPWTIPLLSLPTCLSRTGPWFILFPLRSNQVSPQLTSTWFFFFPITFELMPVCVLDSDQDILFRLTCNLRDGCSSKATACCQRSFWDLRAESTFSWEEALQDPALGCDPKKTWIIRMSIQGFALSPSHKTFWNVMVELLSIGGWVEGCSSQWLEAFLRDGIVGQPWRNISHCTPWGASQCKYFWHWWQHLPKALSVCS